MLDRYLVSAVGGVAYRTAGALVAAGQPRNPIGWLLLASGLMNTVGGNVEGYWRYALFVQPGVLPAGLAMLWVNTRLYELSLVFDILVVLLFPTGRTLARWWWVAGWAIIVGALVRFTALALMPGPLDLSVTIENPIGLDGALGLLETTSGLASGLQIGGAAAAVTALFLRLRRAHGIERQQIKILAYPLALYMLLNAAIIYQIQSPGDGFSTLLNLTWALQTCAAVLVAGAVAMAILRYRLFDIDILINRTLVYLSLTGALLVIYFGGVTLLQGLFRAVSGQSSVLAIILSTLAIAALFQPLRRRIQRGIDRLFYRQQYDPAQILASHAATVRAEVDPEQLTAALIQAADATMQPAHASLWLRKADGS